MNDSEDPEISFELGALKRRGQMLARQLGFDLFGVTTPDPPAHLEVYQDWLQNKRHGSMQYLETERAIRRRSDPGLILEGCQSVIVLGINYLPPSPNAAEAGTKAKVAAYAQGDDYHEVMVARMDLLVKELEESYGGSIKSLVYSDTGPILERELAQRAGLGWIGKNTCLIHPREGSYFLLGEIFLDLALPADEAFVADHCGSCTRCIDACPTECILPDRTIDASRCISYLNIEHRGPVPPTLRPQMEDWVFGCDICQQVCPWNIRFSKPGNDAAFRPRPFLAAPVAADFLSLEDDTYQETFRGSPIKRAKQSGLLRNAAIVAANQSDEASVAPLARILVEAKEPWLREQAAWSLGQIGGTEVRKKLEQRLELEPEASVRRAIDTALDDLEVVD